MWSVPMGNGSRGIFLTRSNVRDCADILCSGCCHRPWDHGVGLGVCAEGLQAQDGGRGGGL